MWPRASFKHTCLSLCRQTVNWCQVLPLLPGLPGHNARMCIPLQITRSKEWFCNQSVVPESALSRRWKESGKSKSCRAASFACGCCYGEKNEKVINMCDLINTKWIQPSFIYEWIWQPRKARRMDWRVAWRTSESVEVPEISSLFVRLTKKSSLIEPTTAAGHALFSATLTDASEKVKRMFFDKPARCSRKVESEYFFLQSLITQDLRSCPKIFLVHWKRILFIFPSNSGSLNIARRSKCKKFLVVASIGLTQRRTSRPWRTTSRSLRMLCDDELWRAGRIPAPLLPYACLALTKVDKITKNIVHSYIG